jgi:pseudaminic acid cytidylyltransferase
LNIAIIPARGGSKRVPKKNIKSFAGKPMIVHAINVAMRSKLFQEVVVTTDDDEIANIAKNNGAQVPFVRPAELSDDHTATRPVIEHAIKTCLNLGWNVDNVCCIYPCVPFLSESDLASGFAMLQKSKDNFIFPVTTFPSAVQRALSKLPEGNLKPLYPEFSLTRTQDLEPAFYDAGQFYWGTTKSWLCGKEIHPNAIGLEIPHWRVVDIDTQDDWMRAELMYKAFLQLNN